MNLYNLLSLLYHTPSYIVYLLACRPYIWFYHGILLLYYFCDCDTRIFQLQNLKQFSSASKHIIFSVTLTNLKSNETTTGANLHFLDFRLPDCWQDENWPSRPSLLTLAYLVARALSNLTPRPYFPLACLVWGWDQDLNLALSSFASLTGSSLHSLYQGYSYDLDDSRPDWSE